MTSVLQDWVQDLTMMQQSVLISTVRGPDGLHKDHVAKAALRWLRRCILLSAFDGVALTRPDSPGGGSFTGPTPPEYSSLSDVQRRYFTAQDEVPLHFHTHLLHAAEILGYKHPEPWVREFWLGWYLDGVNRLHLYPESEEQLDARLGDSEGGWRARETPAQDVHYPGFLTEASLEMAGRVADEITPRTGTLSASVFSPARRRRAGGIRQEIQPPPPPPPYTPPSRRENHR